MKNNQTMLSRWTNWPAVSYSAIIVATVLILLSHTLAEAADCAAENILCIPEEYATPNSAASAVNDGDTVLIDAGTYTGDGIVATWNADNLLIQGVGGMAHMDATEVIISNQKAIFVTNGDNITIDNIEFSNAAVPDENGAGIRAQGGDLTILNSYFHDNEMGILSSNNDQAEILIENTEFAHNGIGRAGYTHNIYINHIAKFTLQYSYSHHATHGHNVKSRAYENHILYNRIMDEAAGNASYQIDIPNGGLTYIIGNTIHQGLNAENNKLISYAAEGDSNPIQEVYLSGNTLVNDRSSGNGIRISGTPTAVIVNNIFDNMDNAVEGNATILADNIDSNANGFVDRANFDFHLTWDSLAKDFAGDPGTANGVDLSPVYEYVHPLNRRNRPQNDVLDAGAFEYGGDDSPMVDFDYDNDVDGFDLAAFLAAEYYTDPEKLAALISCFGCSSLQDCGFSENMFLD